MPIYETSDLLGFNWNPATINALMIGVRQQLDAIKSSISSDIRTKLANCGDNCAAVRAQLLATLDNSVSAVNTQLSTMPGDVSAATISHLAYAIAYGQELGIPDPDWLTAAPTPPVAPPTPPVAPPTLPPDQPGPTGPVYPPLPHGPVVGTCDGQMCQPPTVPTADSCVDYQNWLPADTIDTYARRVLGCMADNVFLTGNDVVTAVLAKGVARPFAWWSYLPVRLVADGSSLPVGPVPADFPTDVGRLIGCPKYFVLRLNSSRDPVATAASIRQSCQQPQPPTTPVSNPPPPPPVVQPPVSCPPPVVQCPPVDAQVVCSDQAWLESDGSARFRDRLATLFPSASAMMSGTDLVTAIDPYLALIDAIPDSEPANEQDYQLGWRTFDPAA